MTIPPLRAVLRNRRLLRTIVAALAFDVAEWALWVGVIVYAFERGGATTAGFAALGLLVPSALAAPIAGVLADGPRPERVLVLGHCAESIALAAATVAVYAEAPLVVVIALTAAALNAVTFARPSTSVVVPGLVSTPSELTAANLIGGWCDSLSVLVGPLAAAGMLALDGSRAVFALCAGLTFVAACASMPLGRGRALPQDAHIAELEHTQVRSIRCSPASAASLGRRRRCCCWWSSADSSCSSARSTSSTSCSPSTCSTSGPRAPAT